MEFASAAVQEAARATLAEFGEERLELEFRLGTIVGGQFVAGVSSDAFRKLTTMLDASPVVRDIQVTETVEYIVGEGKYVIDPASIREPKWNYKKRLRVVDLGDLGTGTTVPWCARAGISLESIEVGQPAPLPSQQRYRRRKFRRSYRYECWSFDLTRVSSNLPGQLDNDDETYEVEVELVDTSVLFVRPLDNVVMWGLELIRDMIVAT
jgi:hypothetical protein